MTGRSFLPFLRGEKAAGWKDAALIEYQSIHGGASTMECRPWGPPKGSGLAKRYTDCGNNTFVGLRVKNQTHDLMYAEFAELKDWNFDAPYFHELYDQKTDPYQQRNIYAQASPALKADLKARLFRARTCKGKGCSLD